jgi:hypothetical protein
VDTFTQGCTLHTLVMRWHNSHRQTAPPIFMGLLAHFVGLLDGANASCPTCRARLLLSRQATACEAVGVTPMFWLVG